jgi:ribonucleoside-triphosphate reductase
MVKWVNIEEVNYIEHNDFVYDIELDKNHYFKANSIYTHNCRLKNDVSDQVNDFSYSLGAGGVMTGSMNVITINVNRLIQDGRDLKTEVEKVHKYQLAFKELFKEYQVNGMLPVYDCGFISLEKQYLTVGINGVVEAAEYLGYDISNNDGYKVWVKNLLKTISDINKENCKKYKCKFNTEFVPAENLGNKFATWDKKDLYRVNRDTYNSYLYKVEDNNISIFDKMSLHGKDTSQYLDGGSAYHCNLEEYPTAQTFEKLLDAAVAEGCEYLCFNIKVTCCEDCGFIDKRTNTACVKCNSKNVSHATRIIGYLKKIKDFSSDRKKEAALRFYNKNS